MKGKAMNRIKIDYLMGVLLMVLSVSLGGGCAGTTIKYYKSAQINDDYKIVAKRPIVESYAKKTNCYEITYDEKGRITNVKYLRGGKPGGNSDFGARIAEILIEYSGNTEKRSFFNQNGEKDQYEKNVYSLLFNYLNDHSQMSLKKYDLDGKAVVDSEGIYERRFTLNQQGQKIKKIFLDKEGNRIALPNGIFEISYSYDAKGNITETRNYGKNGKPIGDDLGYAISQIKYEYDPAGNIILEEWKGYNAEGNIKKDEDGIAETKSKYDMHGDWIEWSFWGEDNRLKEDASGVAIRKLKNDEFGNMVEAAHYGSDGKLKESIHGTAIVRWTLDDRGNRIETRTYGVDGKLKDEGDGPVIVRYIYDSKDSNIGMRYFGVDGKPKENKDGVAEIKTLSDEYGRTIETRYHNLRGELTNNAKSGCALEKTEWISDKETKDTCYDKNGRIIEKKKLSINRVEAPDRPIDPEIEL